MAQKWARSEFSSVRPESLEREGVQPEWPDSGAGELWKFESSTAASASI